MHYDPVAHQRRPELSGIPLYVLLSRGQFAFTTLFHILWPVLTIGLSLFLVVTEAMWLRTNDIAWYHHRRFWGRLFLLNFGVGVVTGLPLEFEFGTNWAPFAKVAGGFFGNMLGFEGAMAFMLEAGFLGVAMLGWQRVPRPVHLIATCMVAIGASMSEFWILVANSWMQTPAGGHIENGQYVVDNYIQAIFNPDMPWGVAHMEVAALETSLFVIGGISAWYILRRRETAFFRRSLLLAIGLAVIITPVQIWLGDSSGKAVFKDQPAKGAAIEGFWDTNPPGTAASWALVAWPDKAQQRNDWSVDIPGVLSFLAKGRFRAQVTGLKAFAPQDQPPLLPVIFYAFRIMAGIGFVLFFLMLWSICAWWRGWLRPEAISTNRWLLIAWVAAIPLGYIAVDMGWTVREVGRQPWVIYGILRTVQGASVLPAASVGYTLAGFFVIYAGLLVAFIIFALRIIRQGPDLTLTAPEPVFPLQEHEGRRASVHRT
jgi:cytochrome bd ubiquinol oxidase subunit I